MGENTHEVFLPNYADHVIKIERYRKLCPFKYERRKGWQIGNERKKHDGVILNY